jgi:hypothetical protein
MPRAYVEDSHAALSEKEHTASSWFACGSRFIGIPRGAPTWKAFL